MKQIIILATLLSVCTGQSLAQVTVVASVSESTIGTEESLTYQIEVRGAGAGGIQTPQPPQADGLMLLQSMPSTSQNISMLNGVVEQSFSFSWTYRPTREGKVTLSQTKVRVADTEYATKAISVTIVPQSSRPSASNRRSRARDPFSSLFGSPVQDNRDTNEISPTDIFIQAVPSKRNVVQNEQVTIEYQLFFREGVQLRQSRLTDSWDAEGFWREEMDVETRPIPQIVVKNGLRYNKIVLKRAAVFPTRSGELTVDALKIESEALLPSRSRDPFRQLFSMRTRFQPVKLSSREVKVSTRALPTGAPPGFLGAVGQYRMKTRVDRSELNVGESLQYVVTISGTGNLATLDMPEFIPPTAFELYDPENKLSLNRSGRVLKGSKTFTYVMVPRSNGSFELPPIDFSYFDPSAGRYRTSHADPVAIHVSGVASTPVGITTTTNGLPVDDIAPPMDAAGEWTRTDNSVLTRRTWPYVVLGIPLFFIVGLIFVDRHRRRLATDLTFARGIQAHPLARKNLKKARSLMAVETAPAFFDELERAVLGFVGNRLNVSERGLTRATLDHLLKQNHVRSELRTRLHHLLDTCDRGRFAPVDMLNEAFESAYEEASGLIVAIDSSIRDGA
jgi:BatD DUF11 like domain